MAKFTCTFKDPDHHVERGDANAATVNVLKAMFLAYDEYLTVEFDTVTKTARVIPVKEMKS